MEKLKLSRHTARLRLTKRKTNQHAPRAPANGPCLARELPGRRDRGSAGQNCAGVVRPSHLPEVGRSHEHERRRRIPKLELLARWRGFRFLFRASALSDGLAEGAGMLPIKGPGQRLAERRVLRVTDYHPHPRDRLQKAPVQAQGTGQRHDYNQPGQPEKHVLTLAPNAMLSNSRGRSHWSAPPRLSHFAGLQFERASGAISCVA